MYRRGEDVHNDVASIFVGSAVFGDAFALGAKACDLGASFRMHAGLVVNEQIDGWAMLAAVFAHAPPRGFASRASRYWALRVHPALSHRLLVHRVCVRACVRACGWVGCVSIVSLCLCGRAYLGMCVRILCLWEREYSRKG